MLTVRCCVCGIDVEVELDEFLQDDDFFCHDCASAALTWCIEETINPN